ncbi:MAG: hypothetical protein LBC41_15345, partial [Clostridiales bacterium]|nr:hypothetical protein [Clostridiales bacterium]
MAKNKQKRASQKELNKKRNLQLNKIREWAKAFPGDQEQLVREMSATFNMTVPKAIKELQAAGAALDPELVEILLKEAYAEDPQLKILRAKCDYMRVQAEVLEKLQHEAIETIRCSDGCIFVKTVYIKMARKNVYTDIQEIRLNMPARTVVFHELSEEDKEMAIATIDKIIEDNLDKYKVPSRGFKEWMLDKLCEILFGEIDKDLKLSKEEWDSGEWKEKFESDCKNGKGEEWVKPFVQVIPDDELSRLFDSRVNLFNEDVLDDDE